MADPALPQYYRKAYQDFTEGLSTRANPLMIKANQFAQLDNAVINETDILQKAPGYVLDGSPFPNVTDSFIRMLTNYKVGTTVNTIVCAAQDDSNVSGTNPTYLVDMKQSYGTGTYNYFGHTVGTALFTNSSPTVTGSTTLWTKHLKAGDAIGTGTSPSVWYEILSVNSDTSITLAGNYNETTTISTNYMARIRLNKATIPNSAIFNNQLIVVNGSETPMVYDNTTLNKLQSPNIHAANFIVPHKNRVFFLNWSGDTSGMQWTAVNDITTIDAASEVDIFPYDNSNTVSAISYSNSLLVFKDNGTIYQITGDFDQDVVGQPSTITRIDVPDNIGVIAGRTCVVVEDNSGTSGYQRLGSKVCFLAETGIYSINSWMQVNKVSWEIQPNVTNLALKSTITATKAYNYTSKAQWDTGTITSLSDTRTTNGISSFFDSLNLSNAKQSDGCLSTFIDTNNDVHTAYISSNGLEVRYNHWLASDNTNVDSLVCNISSTGVAAQVVSGSPQAVSVAVAPNGNVGIISKWLDVSVAASYMFSELSSGTWTHTFTYQSPVYRAGANSIKAKYDAANNCAVVFGQGNATNGSGTHTGAGCGYIKRTSGTWGSFVAIDSQATRLLVSLDFAVDSGTNTHVIFSDTAGDVEYYYSSTGGVSWTNPKVVSLGANNAGQVAIQVNNLLNPIMVYHDLSVSKLTRYNVTSSTTSYISTTLSTGEFYGYTNNSGTAEYSYLGVSNTEQFVFDTNYTTGTAQFVNGTKAVVGTGTKWGVWVLPGDSIKLTTDAEADWGIVNTVNSDTSITLVSNYAGTSTTAAYVAKRTNTVNGPSAITTNIRPNQGLSQQNSVVATCAFGLNANQICLRRVTLFGSWVSPVSSDATLSAYSTYAVTGAVTNGNSITYQCALSTSNSLLEINNNLIVPGTIISTDPTKIYIKATITFILQTFASSSISTLILNYIGIGTDAKMPTAYVFNNEMYLATTAQGQTGNTQILFLDRKGSWGNWTQSATCFARYNQQLYAGSSTNGNIYKLRQGYNYAGSSYNLTAITKEDLLGSIELEKDVNKVYLIYTAQTSGTFTFSYRLDNYLTRGGSTWTDQVVTQTSNGSIEIPINQTCTSIQFKISQNDLDVQVGIVGFTVLYKYLHLR